MIMRGELTGEVWVWVSHYSPERRRRGGLRNSTARLTAGATQVERCVNRLKKRRGVATRCEKRAANGRYRLADDLANLVIRQNTP